MAEVNREWVFRELRRSLVLLASDGDSALSGVPEGRLKPDELALDYDNFRAAVVGNFAAELPTRLVDALTAVSAALGVIRGRGGPMTRCGRPQSGSMSGSEPVRPWLCWIRPRRQTDNAFQLTRPQSPAGR